MATFASINFDTLRHPIRPSGGIILCIRRACAFCSHKIGSFGARRVYFRLAKKKVASLCRWCFLCARPPVRPPKRQLEAIRKPLARLHFSGLASPATHSRRAKPLHAKTHRNATYLRIWCAAGVGSPCRKPTTSSCRRESFLWAFFSSFSSTVPINPSNFHRLRTAPMRMNSPLAPRFYQFL